MDDLYNVIGAFADGERVVPEQLKAALAEPAGRDYLVDVLTLRGLIDAADADVQVVVRRPSRVRGWLGIAALIAVSVAGGYAAGQRELRAGPASASDPRPPSAVTPSTPVVAPPATRVITFEPGVNWEESVGG